MVIGCDPVDPPRLHWHDLGQASGEGRVTGDLLIGPLVTVDGEPYYQVPQPVEQACSPEMARQLKAYGYERVRAPLPIVDSFLPPDFCTVFKPNRRRLRAGGIHWPDARRVALLRLLTLPQVPERTPPEELPSGDEQWLL